MVADPSEVSEGLYMTVEQYPALDEATDGKYEFLDGYVFMLRPPSSDYDERAVDMAGGSIAHAAICARMALLLGNALASSPCMVYTSDARLQLVERQYLYPDLVVACGEQSGTMLINPSVVIEVLSPTIEKRDRGTKFKTYKSLPSVQEYVLIGSEYRSIEVHRREGRFWKEQHYYEGNLVELKRLGISFPFDEVYPRIRL
jgi:Uma2 family endonuclease